jgi:hypothetical protein
VREKLADGWAQATKHTLHLTRLSECGQPNKRPLHVLGERPLHVLGGPGHVLGGPGHVLGERPLHVLGGPGHVLGERSLHVLGGPSQCGTVCAARARLEGEGNQTP